ncbi:hypothetical protein TEA_021324 [Camellia sinensis var. sinensis]|uniref:Prohibitin n=1 Tax=Camellia sinensis var. sinensis TaxID=542762 RepID=A0A4S4DU24_CAMSN|nr:hypothetical protein TEA_021324 [Camellia sinensis var. sinensis]
MGSSQAAMSFLANLARAAFGLGLGATVLNSSLYTVDGGQRAVLFDRFRGVIDETVGEGTHFLVPWLQRPYIFDIRTRPHTFSSISGTKDLQMVNLTLRLPHSENIALLLLRNTHSRAPSRKTLLLSSEPLISEPSPRRTTRSSWSSILQTACSLCLLDLLKELLPCESMYGQRDRGSG